MVLRSFARVFGVGLMLVWAASVEAKTVTLSAADNRTDVFLNLGDTLAVELSSGDVTGFRWVSHLPKASGLTALNEETLPVDKKSGVPVQVRRFRFNAASIGDTAAVFGFETPEKDPSAAPQDTSAYSVSVHIALGSPRVGTAVLLGVYKGRCRVRTAMGWIRYCGFTRRGSSTLRMRFMCERRYIVGRRMGYMYSDRGEWTMLRGDADDENATVYQLNPEREQGSEALLVQDSGASLVQLGRDLEPVDTTMNVTLKRVP